MCDARTGAGVKVGAAMNLWPSVQLVGYESLILNFKNIAFFILVISLTIKIQIKLIPVL